MRPSRSGLFLANPETFCGSARLFVAAALILFAGLRLSADIVITTDGRKIEGDVKLEGTEYVIKTYFGATIRISKYEVKEVKYTAAPITVFTKDWKALGKKKDATADEYYELGKYATKYRLKKQATQAYEKAISIDKDHQGAREAMGLTLYKGEWVSASSLRSKGLMKVGDEWVSREEAEAEKEKTAAERPKPIVRRRDIPCPKCEGTGVMVWLPCLQCDQSKRPGYIFSMTTNRYEVCNRCWGKGKLPGLKCDLCNGTGRVDPEKLEKKVPKPPRGYEFCPVCNGTGVEEWVRCPQCGRSPAPGYVNVGDHLEICPRCNGRGFFPAFPCQTCGGKGLIKLPEGADAVADAEDPVAPANTAAGIGDDERSPTGGSSSGTKP
ncbi:MAG: hypothetical protein JW909_01690 [Planctomycetes bacterium]|nr:hypothetical protein [Planctomycetota bacterium]